VKMVQQSGWSATTLHSDKTQTQREAALQQLRDGEVQALVATDVAGRGLDVPDVCKYLYKSPTIPLPLSLGL
jgi:ATP-dependent RNA helicase DDX23/PRP28